jgi:hypothetical protein
LIVQIIKAHRDFDKSKHRFQRSSNAVPVSELTGTLNANLVFGYFMQGKKTWADWARTKHVH